MLLSLFRTRNLQPVLLSFMVCTLLVTCTLTLYQYARQQEHERIGRAFNELAKLKAQRVVLRVEGYVRTLLDVRGLFVADPNVTEPEFQRYLLGIEVAQRYPALLRLGYAPRMTPEIRAKLESRLHRMGQTDFKAALGDFPILYSYPTRELLLGEKLNEGQLRSSMLAKAADSNLPQISAHLALRFQSEHRSGFIVCVPLYGNEVAPATVEQRRPALSGYLFAVFRAKDLIVSTIGPDLERQMGLALYDGPVPDEANLAYDSGRGVQSPAHDGARLYASVQRAEVAGRPWTFLFVARPAFVKANQSNLALVVLVSGLLTSVLGTQLAYVGARRWIAEGKIRHLAFHDELTGLPNRAKLRLRISEAIRREPETKQPCALAIVELIRFRDINYTLGHLIGDEVLKQASVRICQVVGKDVMVARISNVQFGILLNAGNDEAMACAQRLVHALEEPLPAGDSKYELGARAGIASFPAHGSDADELIRHADIALNMARTSGAEYALYDQRLDPYKPQRLALLSAFRQAVKEEQLQLYCQPKADLRTGLITSVEALVRWQHPDYGLIMPDQFISLIEPTELIQLLTQRMLETSMHQCYEWRQKDVYLPLAVNLSTRNLLNPGLPELIGGLMRTWGADASWVDLEITESSIMDDPVLSLRVLNQLHTMGFKLYVDDFGTGYSSLSYLMKLPVAVIKIDHSFTLNMIRDPDAAAIVKAMIDLAHNMGMKVVAEGAATREIWDALVRLDCDEAQGYYISAPLPAHAFSAWLERSQWRLAPAA